MKILLIAKNFNRQEGAGRHALEIKNALEHLGFEVGTIIGFSFNIFRARKRAKDFDIVHALDVWPFGVYGWFSVLGTSKKLFINGIGTYSVLPDNNFLKKFLMKRALLRANQIFCISDYTKKRILEKVRLNNIKVVFYGLTILPALNEEEIKKYREIYKIKDEFPILLTVGAIKERKGQFDTLKSASLLKKQYPDFKYLMLGYDGDKYYVQKIKDYARENNLENNYEIISGTDDKILSFFYQICDIFLLNYNNDKDHFEGWGAVFLEAAQFGKPVIGSRDCGIENALKNDYNGYLTGQKNHNEIKDKILLAIKNRIYLSQNSKDFSKNFSWDKTVREYIKFYEQN